MKNSDEKYIERCFNLANIALGDTDPNPLVGAVIVHDGKIIGEGYHKRSGEAHAEVNAVNSVKDKSMLPKSTIYVNLEPCSHFGKTPPCSNLIIDSGIKRVVVSNLDPNPKVAGKGIEMMRNAGIEVETGVLKEKGEELNRRFFTFHNKKRPYIILKWAKTLDGFMDVKRTHENEKKSYWISNQELKTRVHQWRSEETAIMVGANTAINDNPKLNVREWQGADPLRIALAIGKELPGNLNLFDGSQKTILFTDNKYLYKDLPIEIFELKEEDFSLELLLNVLYEKSVQSLIVEGGKELLSSFIKSDLWDEARVLTGNKYFIEGLKAPLIDVNPHRTESFSKDKIDYYFNNTKLEKR